MQVEVEIPAGYYPGSELKVTTADGGEAIVTIPDGVGPGQYLLVDVPGPPSGPPLANEASCDAVDVTVPDGCFAGMEFTVEWNGQCFNVMVPEGVGPGCVLAVDVPQITPPSASIPDYSQQLQQPPMAPAAPTRSPAQHSTDTMYDLSDSSEDESAKFGVGMAVEALNTDGTWIPATVVDFDPGGRVYSVSLQDGQLKYCVKEKDLRIPRFLLSKK